MRNARLVGIREKRAKEQAPAWISSSSNSTALFSSGVHLVLVKTKISSVASPQELNTGKDHWEHSNYQKKELIKKEHSYYQKGTHQKEHSYYQKEHSYYQKEHSYYQKGTHQKGTLILSKRNTHIIKKEHSYYQKGTHQKEHSYY